MSELVSIIVPVYNVEKYVAECLESIKNQTYVNFEVIIINDGSTDDSLKICNAIAENDNRFFVYNKINGGLSDARNYGIKRAFGTLITFIDSDDYIDSQYIECLVKVIEETDSDIACCGYRRVDDDKKCIRTSVPTTSITPLNNRDAMRELINEGKVKTQAWAKMYKKYIFDNLEFPYGKYHEDMYIMLLAVKNAQRVVVSPKVLYNYRYNSSSITGGVFNIKRQEAVDAMQARLDFIREHYPNLESDQLRQLVWTCCHVNYLIIKSGKWIDFRKIFRQNRSIIRRRFISFMRSNASLKSKLFAMLCVI